MARLLKVYSRKEKMLLKIEIKIKKLSRNLKIKPEQIKGH